MKAGATPMFAIAAALVIWAGSASAATLSPPANHDAVIAVSTSFDASPATVMSPAVAAAPANTSQIPGLFEQESPTPLIAMALLVGLARVGKALFDRRRRMDRSRRGGGHRAPRLSGPRPAAMPFLIGDEVV